MFEIKYKINLIPDTKYEDKNVGYILCVDDDTFSKIITPYPTDRFKKWAQENLEKEWMFEVIDINSFAVCFSCKYDASLFLNYWY